MTLYYNLNPHIYELIMDLPTPQTSMLTKKFTIKSAYTKKILEAGMMDDHSTTTVILL